MKKTILLSILTASFLFAESIVQQEKIDCASGLKGYTLKVLSEKINKVVEFNSCVDSTLKVKLKNENERIINGELITFVNGYTQVEKEAGNSCQEGYYQLSENVTCSNLGLTKIDEGFLNLSTYSKILQIVDNPNLNDLSGFRNLVDIGGLNLYHSSYSNVDDLKNLTNVNGVLGLHGNSSLTNIRGLSNLKKIEGELYLTENPNLKDLSPLNNLEYIGGSLRINKNTIFTTKLDSSSYLCQNPDKIEFWYPDNSSGIWTSVFEKADVNTLNKVCN